MMTTDVKGRVGLRQRRGIWEGSNERLRREVRHERCEADFVPVGLLCFWQDRTGQDKQLVCRGKRRSGKESGSHCIPSMHRAFARSRRESESRIF